MSQPQAIAEFQAITGADEATARRFLLNTSWNVELALSNYFDAGILPPTDFQPQIVSIPVVEIYKVADDGEHPVSTQLRAGNITLPLQAISVVLIVKQFVAEVEVLQRFVNHEQNPIEAIFTFQQEDVSIYEFYVEINKKKIISVCEEKQTAFNKYDDAIAGGHGAYLLDKDCEDAFKLNVGNLPPQSECVISIKYATMLTTEGDALKLTVPITKAPLYNVLPSSQSDERFPNGISLRANLEMPSAVVGLESETHDIHYEIKGSTATLTLQGSPTDQPRREFALIVGLQEPHKPSSVVESIAIAPSHSINNSDNTNNNHNIERRPSRNQPAIMLCFYPVIENVGEELLMEYVFLVDRSGSMSGSRIAQTKNALQLFLRSIPVGSLFNIVGFGSSYEKLFPSSVVYDDSSFAKATQYTASMQANFVSTKILEPLKDILSKPVHPKFPRQLFVLTDGEVDNTEQVIKMVKNIIATTRIFSLGIGAEASKRLVKGIAKAGKGHAEFVVSGARMEPKVLSQLKRAMQPHLTARVDWGSLTEDIVQAPAVLPPVFPGDPIVVFGLPKRELTPADDRATVAVMSTDGSSRNVEILFSSSSYGGSVVGVLAASAAIKDTEKKLEEKLITEAEAKAQILPLAKKYSLVTSYTSLVAQEVRENPTEGTMESREVSTQAFAKKVDEEVKSRKREDVVSPPRQYDARADGLSDAAIIAYRPDIGHMIASTATSVKDSIVHGATSAMDMLSSAITPSSRREYKPMRSKKSQSKSNDATNSFDSDFSRASAASSPVPFAASSPSPSPTHSPMSTSTTQQTLSSFGAPPPAFAPTAPPPPSRPPPPSLYASTGLDFAQVDARGSSPQRFSSNSYAALDEDDEDGMYDYLGGELCAAEMEAHNNTANNLVDPFDAPSPHNFSGFTYTPQQQVQQQPLQPQANYYAQNDLLGGDLDSLVPTHTHAPSASSYAFDSLEAKTRVPSFGTPSVQPLVDPNRRPLDVFIELQQASGSWKLTEAFLSFVKLSIAQIETQFGSTQGWFGNVCATVLGIAVLDVRFAASKDEWSLLSAKAIRWITKELQKNNSTEDVNGLLNKAKNVLQL